MTMILYIHTVLEKDVNRWNISFFDKIHSSNNSNA